MLDPWLLKLMLILLWLDVYCIIFCVTGDTGEKLDGGPSISHLKSVFEVSSPATEYQPSKKLNYDQSDYAKPAPRKTPSERFD